ncbi:MAG TPA: HD domain-containing protein [Chloroflexia bacterium]|nr:HD domain-containing protein [Chloroflexia bacterium]
MTGETETHFGRPEYEELLRKYFIPSQVRLIMMAYRFSKYGHRGQSRDGGERYFNHPRAASLILIEQGVYDHEVIIAALLHDVMEDSFILTWEDLEYIFGSRVCTIVKQVTKESWMAKEEYMPRLVNGLPEAWLVKLADRLHNMSTLDTCTREKQLKQIKETREKIMPLCHRLAQKPNYAGQAAWFEREIEARCRDLE